MIHDRRSFLKVVGGGAFLAATTRITGAAAAPKKGKPNIILVMADDQGWGDVGYNNHPFVKTPNLDAMSKVSLRLDRFYAAAPICSPTRASVLTGRHPHRSNVLSHGRSMRPQEITIAAALKKAGYTTGHFGKFHVGSMQKSSPVNPGKFGFDRWFSAPNFFDQDPVMSSNGVAVQCKGESSQITVDETIKFITQQAKGDKPFLAVVWFAAPHDPHVASAEDLAIYKGKPNAGYYAEITAMDRAFGKLRNAVRSLGISNNTILWYNSDNGGLVNTSSGGRGRKGWMYEGGLRVPAMIEWPNRIAKPRTSNVPCFTSDIFPTLLELTGTKKPHNRPLDGISIASLIDGKMTSRSKPIGFWSPLGRGRGTWSHKIMGALLKAQKEGKDVGDPSRLDMDAAEIKKIYPEDKFPGRSVWLDWPWKLHRIDKRGEPKFELYNLATDPNESKNQAAAEPARVKKMTAALEVWLASVLRSLNGKDYT
ncbi:MAG: sulfatase-like hydrolase/transferase [bacterium]|nr:sulfatase-like hydrolase/transferase [bacterium]